MTNNEIKFKIESLLEQTSRSVQQKYCGFKSKNKNGLLNILQEIKCLFNEENEIDNSDLIVTNTDMLTKIVDYFSQL
ncbi:3493_t:CDS:2 [Entrophospora sp. SA101]|nr:3493_t:CDS:2 [Entrophospora sp. SA101]